MVLHEIFLVCLVALDQYYASLTSGDPWKIVEHQGHESDQEQDLRPTNSARRVRELFEQVTGRPDHVSCEFFLTWDMVDRYSTLPDIRQRLDFLSTIQLPILDLYRSRLSAFLDGFESVSASFVRAVPGAISRDPSRSGGDNSIRRETTGVSGAQKLSKALISTKYIIKAMQSWGDEMVRKIILPVFAFLNVRQFFLEFWQEIIANSNLRVRADEDHLMPTPPPLARGTERDGGSIFDKLIDDYGALAERAEDMVLQHVCGEIGTELKAHFFRCV